MHDFLCNPVYRDDMQKIYESRDSWSELENNSVLISGASGMIASYICMFLIFINEAKGMHVEIYACVRDKDKAAGRFGRYIEAGYFHLMIQDVCCSMEKGYSFDYVIHAASLASPQYYGNMPVETVLPNIIGTYELLKYVKKGGLKSFLFLSSGAVYGPVCGKTSVTEDTAGDLDYLQAGNFYGESKRCGELLCKAYSMEYCLPARCVRIHHSYGPTLDIKGDARVFSEFVGNIVNEQSIVIKSAGIEKRAFCYMTDTVAGIFRVLLEGENGECYNLGNSHEYISISELAEKLIDLFPEKNLKIVYGDRDLKSYVSGNAASTIPVNTEKIENLGWRASVSVEEGFYRTVKALLWQEK